LSVNLLRDLSELDTRSNDVVTLKIDIVGRIFKVRGLDVSIEKFKL